MTLATELPYSVFSLTMAMRVDLLAGRLLLLEEGRVGAAKSPATGVVRKNHLKPRSVRLAATDSGVRNGMPWRSAMALAVTRDARLIGADQRRAPSPR